VRAWKIRRHRYQFSQGNHCLDERCTPAQEFAAGNCPPANERFKSLEWRRIDLERFPRESLKAYLRVRFPGRLPGLARSSDRFAVKWLPGLAGTSPRRIRRRLQRAGRGTAQEVQSNAFGQGSQRGWSYGGRTKEAFPPHSEDHTLSLEYSGGSPLV
jgi:hypothetical protein